MNEQKQQGSKKYLTVIILVLIAVGFYVASFFFLGRH
jgi:hypothetical protein